MLFYGKVDRMLLKIISAIICSTFLAKSQNTSGPVLYPYHQVIGKIAYYGIWLGKNGDRNKASIWLKTSMWSTYVIYQYNQWKLYLVKEILFHIFVTPWEVQTTVYGKYT